MNQNCKIVKSLSTNLSSSKHTDKTEKQQSRIFTLMFSWRESTLIHSPFLRRDKLHNDKEARRNPQDGLLARRKFDRMGTDTGFWHP
mmetsp:Transcript_24843/g.28364  ORF Transcript_24843/g.28364 Transcript_24843/m.28364 type:complete len:87 (+) Transcript_24843:391-651(+)